MTPTWGGGDEHLFVMLSMLKPVRSAGGSFWARFVAEASISEMHRAWFNGVTALYTTPTDDEVGNHAHWVIAQLVLAERRWQDSVTLLRLGDGYRALGVDHLDFW
jgi:hypothetical protein